MNKSSKYIILISLAAGLATSFLHASVQDEPQNKTDAVAARQESMLKRLLEKAPKDTKNLQVADMVAAAHYWLNQDTAVADQEVIRLSSPETAGEVRPGSTDETFYYRQIYLLQRVYFLFNSRSEYFPGRMSKAAEDAVAERMWKWASAKCTKKDWIPQDVWWSGSENYHVIDPVSFWGATQILAGHPDYRDRNYSDGTSVQEMARAFNDYFKGFARERASKGLLMEVSSAYNNLTINALYNVADFSLDPLTRQRMRMFMDLYWADWGIEQIDGVRGGAHTRCYAGGKSFSGAGGGGVGGWLLFGVGKEPNLEFPGFSIATTPNRPSPVVTDVVQAAAAARGTYAYVSRRLGRVMDTTPETNEPEKINLDKKPAAIKPKDGDVLHYTYCTPDFVMGTLMVPALKCDAWALVTSQNRWEGVIFAGNPTARIFPQEVATKATTQYFNQSWSVQNKGVMIEQRLKTANKLTKGHHVWFDGSLKREEREGWVFAEAPQAYAAVRVVGGGSSQWAPEMGKKGELESGKGMWFKCQDEFAPVIIEVARKSDYPDFAAFQKAILKNTLTWKDKRLDYRSDFYKTQLTLFADYSKPPQVDGVSVNYNPPKAYDSPFIQCDFGSGVVTLRYGDKKQILNFNE